MTQERRDEMTTERNKRIISWLPGRRTTTMLELVLCVCLTTNGEQFGCNRYRVVSLLLIVSDIVFW